MNELFLKIVTSPPRQSLQCGEDVSTAAYTIVCAQVPQPHHRIQLLQTRLRTSTETSAAQNVYYLANTCISADLPPDDVESLVEDLVDVVKEHPIWPEFIGWVCALIHYYCTDDFTVSLFAEFGVPQMALRALGKFAHHPQLALSANVLLSHFNSYDLVPDEEEDGCGDGVIASLVRVLQLHPSDVAMVQAAVRNLAMFTAYCPNAPARFSQTSREFVEAGGLTLIEALMLDHFEEESMVCSLVHLLDNVTSAMHTDRKVLESAANSRRRSSSSDSENNYSDSIMSNSSGDNNSSNISGSSGGKDGSISFAMYESDTSALSQRLTEALSRFLHSEELCLHIVRIFCTIPRSRYIDLHLLSTLLPQPVDLANNLDIPSSADGDGNASNLVGLDMHSNPESGNDTANGFRGEPLVQSCVKLLVHVAMTTRELKPLIHSTGCTCGVLSAMRHWPSNCAIQEQGCSLLSYLSFDSESITQAITTQGGISLVLRAIHNHGKQDEKVFVAACAALSGLTFNNSACQGVIAESDGIACILSVMRESSSAKLQENGCLALGTLCWNSALKAEVIQQGGVQVVMHALEEYYTCPGVVKNACRALAQVVFNGVRDRETLCAEGIIPLILRGMENQPSYDRAQIHGCVALSYLCWTNEGNAAQITANRGYRVVVEAMRNHPHSAEVQEHACRALANINHVSIHESAAALEQIVAAMRRHERMPAVQEEACRAIVTLCLAAAVNKDQLSALGGADVVLAAMRNFPHVVLVQQEACNSVAYMAYEHVALNQAITQQNGVSLLLAAMREHRTCPKLQLNACGGLSALAFDNTVAQKQIYDLDGVRAIIDAMANFERLRMLELGCSVLGTLAWNAEIKEKVSVVAVPEMVKAMRVHESSALLQKSICRAISQFAFNSEKNRRLLVEVGAIPLIVHAMRTHLTTEKLIAHALKALTYLCWESTQVAELILAENIEEVLHCIILHYDGNSGSTSSHNSMHEGSNSSNSSASSGVKRILNETMHLSKILFRKTGGASIGESQSPSPSVYLVSPPFISPTVPYSTQTPYAGRCHMYSSQPPSPLLYATGQPHPAAAHARRATSQSQSRSQAGVGLPSHSSHEFVIVPTAPPSQSSSSICSSAALSMTTANALQRGGGGAVLGVSTPRQGYSPPMPSPHSSATVFYDPNRARMRGQAEKYQPRHSSRPHPYALSHPPAGSRSPGGTWMHSPDGLATRSMTSSPHSAGNTDAHAAASRSKVGMVTAAAGSAAAAPHTSSRVHVYDEDSHVEHRMTHSTRAQARMSRGRGCEANSERTAARGQRYLYPRPTREGASEEECGMSKQRRVPGRRRGGTQADMGSAGTRHGPPPPRRKTVEASD